MLIINTLLWRVEFGIWLSNTTEKFEISLGFASQILRSRMFILIVFSKVEILSVYCLHVDVEQERGGERKRLDHLATTRSLSLYT